MWFQRLRGSVGRGYKMPTSLLGRCSCATAGMTLLMMWLCAKSMPGAAPYALAMAAYTCTLARYPPGVPVLLAVVVDSALRCSCNPYMWSNTSLMASYCTMSILPAAGQQLLRLRVWGFCVFCFATSTRNTMHTHTGSNKHPHLISAYAKHPGNNDPCMQLAVICTVSSRWLSLHGAGSFMGMSMRALRGGWW